MRIYFKGSGVVSTLGDGNRVNVDNLHQSRIIPETIEIRPRHKTVSAAYFPVADPGIRTGPSRIHTIIERAVDEALSDAGLNRAQIRDAGLFVGSTSFDIHAAEHTLKSSGADINEIARRTPPYTGPTTHIAKRFGIRGPVFTFNTACTASANALMYAAEAVRGGRIRHAVVVGFELFNEMTVLGFSSLELLSRQGMRPFHAERDGMVLGEACGAVVLTAEPQTHRFGYLGGANLADNHGITSCNPDGSSVSQAIDNALRNADVSPEQIRLVKAHGTASPSNDQAEARGLERIFESVPPITVFKPAIGHTLGACGIVELILFYRSLIEERAPVFDAGYTIADEYPLRLVADKDNIGPGHYLLNYFAFGGNNTCLIVSNA